MNRGTIIGDVINHGKKPHWTSGQGVHYHCTLDAGENTLEVQLLRQALQCVTEHKGKVRKSVC